MTILTPVIKPVIGSIIHPLFGDAGGIVLGPELITENADFQISDTSPTGTVGAWMWDATGKWAIAGGVIFVVDSSSDCVYDGWAPTTNKTYWYSYNLLSGSVFAARIGNVYIDSTVGELNTGFVTANNTNPLTFSVFVADAIIDNFSVKEVL